MLQPGSSIISCEMPVYAFLSSVSCNSPWFKEISKGRKIRDSIIYDALATKSG